MTIEELIKELQEFGELEEICISGDPEGNDIRTISHLSLEGLGLCKDPDEDKQVVVIYPTDNILNL